MEAPSKKRKREDDPPVVIFSVPDRPSFVHIIAEDETLDDMKSILRKRYACSPDASVNLEWLYDDKSIPLLDDDDIAAFRAAFRLCAPSATPMHVSVSLHVREMPPPPVPDRLQRTASKPTPPRTPASSKKNKKDPDAQRVFTSDLAHEISSAATSSATTPSKEPTRKKRKLDIATPASSRTDLSIPGPSQPSRVVSKGKKRKASPATAPETDREGSTIPEEMMAFAMSILGVPSTAPAPKPPAAPSRRLSRTEKRAKTAELEEAQSASDLSQKKRKKKRVEQLAGQEEPPAPAGGDELKKKRKEEAEAGIVRDSVTAPDGESTPAMEKRKKKKKKLAKGELEADPATQEDRPPPAVILDEHSPTTKKKKKKLAKGELEPDPAAQEDGPPPAVIFDEPPPAMEKKKRKKLAKGELEPDCAAQEDGTPSAIILEEPPVKQRKKKSKSEEHDVEPGTDSVVVRTTKQKDKAPSTTEVPPPVIDLEQLPPVKAKKKKKSKPMEDDVDSEARVLPAQREESANEPEPDLDLGTNPVPTKKKKVKAHTDPPLSDASPSDAQPKQHRRKSRQAALPCVLCAGEFHLFRYCPVVLAGVESITQRVDGLRADPGGEARYGLVISELEEMAEKMRRKERKRQEKEEKRKKEQEAGSEAWEAPEDEEEEKREEARQESGNGEAAVEAGGAPSGAPVGSSRAASVVSSRAPVIPAGLAISELPAEGRDEGSSNEGSDDEDAVFVLPVDEEDPELAALLAGSRRPVASVLQALPSEDEEEEMDAEDGMTDEGGGAETEDDDGKGLERLARERGRRVASSSQTEEDDDEGGDVDEEGVGRSIGRTVPVLSSSRAGMHDVSRGPPAEKEEEDEDEEENGRMDSGPPVVGRDASVGVGSRIGAVDDTEPLLSFPPDAEYEEALPVPGTAAQPDADESPQEVEENPGLTEPGFRALGEESQDTFHSHPSDEVQSSDTHARFLDKSLHETLNGTRKVGRPVPTKATRSQESCATPEDEDDLPPPTMLVPATQEPPSHEHLRDSIEPADDLFGMRAAPEPEDPIEERTPEPSAPPPLSPPRTPRTPIASRMKDRHGKIPPKPQSLLGVIINSRTKDTDGHKDDDGHDSDTPTQPKRSTRLRRLSEMVPPQLPADYEAPAAPPAKKRRGRPPLPPEVKAQRAAMKEQAKREKQAEKLAAKAAQKPKSKAGSSQKPKSKAGSSQKPKSNAAGSSQKTVVDVESEDEPVLSAHSQPPGSVPRWNTLKDSSSFVGDDEPSDQLQPSSPVDRRMVKEATPAKDTSRSPEPVIQGSRERTAPGPSQIPETPVVRPSAAPLQAPSQSQSQPNDSQDLAETPLFFPSSSQRYPTNTQMKVLKAFDTQPHSDSESEKSDHAIPAAPKRYGGLALPTTLGGYRGLSALWSQSQRGQMFTSSPAPQGLLTPASENGSRAAVQDALERQGADDDDSDSDSDSGSDSGSEKEAKASHIPKDKRAGLPPAARRKSGLLAFA